MKFTIGFTTDQVQSTATLALTAKIANVKIKKQKCVKKLQINKKKSP